MPTGTNVALKRQIDNPPFGRPWWEIVGLVHERRRESTPLFNAMYNVRQRYNGPALDFVLPWWSGVDGELQNSQFTPLLIAEIVDGMALQAGSVDAEIFSPSIEPGKQKGVRSREYASLRRGALLHTYEKSRWKIGRRRLFRQLVAYASCCAMVMPDDRVQAPRIEIRDVLTAFPDQRAAEDLRDHEDVGFVTGRSAEWLRNNYPETMVENGGPIPIRPGDDRQMWDVLEWIDSESVVLGLMGPRETRFGTSTWADGYEQSIMELRRWRNKAGCLPVMIPSRVTLDMVMSQVMNLTGHVDLIAKLQLIDVIQSEKALQPDMYMLGADGRAPRVISNGGEWAEGREGKINELMNVASVGTVNGQPDPLARATIDRVERNTRMSGGTTPQMGGESRGPLRTGRAIDEMHTIALEPKIQELHELMESWQPHLNEAVLRTYSGYYGSKTYSMYTGKTASRSQFEFVPRDHIENVYDTAVSYAIAGAGVVETNVVLMQMLGGEIMGKRSAMRRHPWIDDADAMLAEMDEEEIESAVKAMVINQVMNREAPGELLIFLEEERRKPETPDIIAAWSQANDRLKELQATQAPPAPEGMMMPPEMMPGANAGPDGAMMQAPPPPELGPGAGGITPGQGGMREVFNALRSTGQELA